MSKKTYISISQSFIDNLKDSSGVNKTSELVEEALILYSWVLNDVKNGRKIISMDENGDNQKQMVTPILENF